MRKHNVKFAQRWSRARGDTSNMPQQMAHRIVHDKMHQLLSNALLMRMLKPYMPKRQAFRGTLFAA